MNRNLEELTPEIRRRHRTPGEVKYGPLYRPLKSLQHVYQRIIGKFGPEDSFTIACFSELPRYFLTRGCMIPHPFGITLSADEVGADCLIGQNVTIGTSDRNTAVGEHTRDKPRLGHLVRCYAGAVISGNVRIGNNVIVAANAFVDIDVPDDSIVYGHNIVKPFAMHHKTYLKKQLWHCINVYRLVPGLVYVEGKLYIDRDYAEQRAALFDSL
jgi:hypothetical protein